MAKSTSEVNFRELNTLVSSIGVLPLLPQTYNRTTNRIDGAFFLEESIRFFNYGAAPGGSGVLGEAFVQKRFPRITDASFKNTLTDFCRRYTEVIYDHIANIHGYINGKTISEFTVEWAKSSRWVQAAAKDDPLKAVFTPHALFGNLQGPAINNVVQLHRLILGYGQSVSTMNDLHRGVNAVVKKLTSEQESLIYSDPWNALTSSEWIGNAHSVAFDTATDHKFLESFDTGSGVGLTEKIYATIILCISTASFNSSTLVFSTPDTKMGQYMRITYESRLLEQELRKELDKLRGKFGKEKLKVSLFETWLDGIRQIEYWLYNVFTQANLIPMAVGTNGVSGIVRSDLTWGILLCSYLRLFLLRTISLAVTASIPFRQIYEGGRLGAFDFGREVPGVVGLLSISLWEYMTGSRTDHPFSRGARTYTPAISGWDKEGWVDPSPDKSITAPKEFRNMPNPLSDKNSERVDPFGINYNVATESNYVGDDVRKIYSMTQLPLTPLSKHEPSPLQIYAGLNFRRPLIKEKNETKAQLRTRTMSALTLFNEFPPRGPFGGSVSNQSEGLPPILIELNPPVLDSFFVLGDKKNWIFNKWGEGSDSCFSYANKLTCQLQMYVAGWLCTKFLEEGQQQSPEFSDVLRQIKFTQGSLPFGGKFPPHASHRDGYGVDCSLYGSRLDYWYHSTFWPRDDKQIKRKTETGGTEKVFLSEVLMNEREPFRRKCQKVQQVFAKLLNQPNLTKEQRMQIRKRIHDELVSFIPKEYLDKYVDKEGYHTLGALPFDVLIARYRDNQNKRRQGPGGPTYVFREHLKKHVYNDQKTLENLFRRRIIEFNEDSINSEFNKPISDYMDWPIFPDRTSHWAHHVGHMAVLLSMPLEVCWGAPLYHFRALRAICIGFLEAPEHPFILLTESSPKGPNRFPWPLPIPRLQFMPHDHHHHWHLNYWRTDNAPLPLEYQSRLNGRIENHFDFVAACLPMWIMLGVDFKPFEQYLIEFQKSITGLASSSVSNEVIALQILLHEDQRRITGEFPKEFLQTRDQFRKRLVTLALEMFEDPGNLITQWPVAKSRLAGELKNASMIKQGVDRIVASITKDMLPDEILETLERKSDDQDFQYEKSSVNTRNEFVDDSEKSEIHQGESEGRADSLDERLKVPNVDAR